jgi:rubrerythrin
MKREEKSYALYSEMADRFSDSSLSARWLLRIAAEEAGHKLRFEKLYDEEILREN